MSLGNAIDKFLEKHPGSKAIEIAEALDVTRKEVNSFLYRNKDSYRQDDNYRWYLPESYGYSEPVLAKLNNISDAKEFSEQQFRRLADWKHGYSHSDDGYYKYVCENGDVIYCDSKSELSMLEYLEDNDLMLAVGGQALCIDYDSYFVGGKSYYPDIVVLTPKHHIAIIEVKAATAMSNHNNMEKYEALAEYCRNNGFEYMMVDPAEDFITYDEIEEMKVNTDLLQHFESLENSNKKLIHFDGDDVEDWYYSFGTGYTKKEFNLQVHSLIMFYNWFNTFKNGFNVYSKPVKLDKDTYDVLEIWDN